VSEWNVPLKREEGLCGGEIDLSHIQPKKKFLDFSWTKSLEVTLHSSLLFALFIATPFLHSFSTHLPPQQQLPPYRPS
jgi:hypothetical protein